MVYCIIRVQNTGFALLLMVLLPNVTFITQDRVIDDNLKRQIKNQTLHACRLFLLTRIFQYISNWSKVFGHLPTQFLQYT